MQKIVVPVMLALIMLSGAPRSFASQDSLCGNSDAVCREFEKLSEAEQFDKIIEKIDPKQTYSESSRNYIGKAYLALAGRESNTPEQEEQYCRKALEYGQTQAYMGLYFIYAQKDEEAALGFLREYVLTGPADSVPFVILGESELGKKNYRAADIFLREAKRVARASSARVDWMLFQVNYLLENYRDAGEMLERALTNGRFDNELKALLSDSRFEGIERRPEFRKYRDRFQATKACSS